MLVSFMIVTFCFTQGNLKKGPYNTTFDKQVEDSKFLKFLKRFFVAALVFCFLILAISLDIWLFFIGVLKPGSRGEVASGVAWSL